jgi:hypothetical protein
LVEKSTTWITTGATHAPASSAATPPMVKASITEPRLDPVPTLAENFEKSISNTSNIASASATNRTAMPRLNHGDELMVPNVCADRITISPSTP